MIDRNIRILIVEDEMTDAALLQRQLRKVFSEPEIKVSDTLLNARYTTKMFLPELIFSDYNLVDFTGEDVILNLKDIFPEVPIVLVTGTLNNEEIAANTILKGAAAFFLKKDMQQLHERMEPILEKILQHSEEQTNKLEKERQQREELARMHSILKEASAIDEEKSNTNLVTYYQRILAELNDNIGNIIR